MTNGTAPFDSRAVALCAPTLVADLKTCSARELDAMLDAAHAAQVTSLDLFASHFVQVAAGTPGNPGAPRESVVDTVAAIRATNLTAPEVLRSGRSVDLRARFTDAALSVQVVEFLSAWPRGADSETRSEATAVCDVAAFLGAPLVVAACVDAAIDARQAAAGLMLAADIAADRGVEIAVEWLPGTGVEHVDSARDLIAAAGRDNVGYLVDSLHWHFQPGGPAWETLGALAPDRILFLQLSDGIAADVEPGRSEPSERLLPGEGEIDLGRLVTTIHDLGARPIIASEVFNRRLLAELGPAGLARTATDATRSLMDRRARVVQG